MKKLLLLFLFIILLVGCRRYDYDYDYEYKGQTKVYAYSLSNNEILLIDIDLEIKNEADVFNLYTINQNYLPVGYTSFCYTNLELISSSVTNKEIIYVVSDFIKLVDNLEVFKSLIYETNYLLFEKESIFINNNKKV